MTLGALGWVVIHAAWEVAAIGAALALFLRLAGGSIRLRYATSFGALMLAGALPMATATALATMTKVPDAARTVADAGALGSPSPATDALFALYVALTPGARWVALAWIAGVVVLAVRWAGAWWLISRRTSRAMRAARPVWRAWLRAVAARMGVTSPVELRESSAVDTPTLIGHRRPVVVLPVPAFEALPRPEAESVLAHELAHVGRGDFLANAAQTVVEILLFFHPAVWWMSRVVREQREQCCDDVAVRTGGSRLVYVRALTRLETLRSRGPLAPLVLGAHGGSLLRRIERLVGETSTGGCAAARRILLAVAVVAVACLSVAGSLLLPPTTRVLMTMELATTRYTVHAVDPAGEFSVTFERGRPTRAIVGGVPIAADRLLSRGDSLFLPLSGGAGYFALHLRPGGFTWTPRRRS